MAAYGPGNPKYDHTPDEQIELAEYQLGIDILTDLLAGL